MESGSSDGKDFANTRDPTIFAAASDTAVGKVVEFEAVLQNYSDVGIHACLGGRTRLSGTPPEEIEEHGDCVWSHWASLWIPASEC